jgi:GT2 family glycosyltransferase
MPHIDVGIPWEPGQRLGFAVNRFMALVEDWALILDWDVALVNVGWYDLCMHAIEQVGHQAGLLSCVTNRIGCPLQRDKTAPASDVLDEHRAHALAVQARSGGVLEDVTDSQFKLSGLFFLTHREAFDKVGGMPPDKFIGMDNWYHARIKEAGYRIYVIKGLYCYHGYRRQWNNKPSGGSV